MKTVGPNAKTYVKKRLQPISSQRPRSLLKPWERPPFQLQRRPQSSELRHLAARQPLWRRQRHRWKLRASRFLRRPPSTQLLRELKPLRPASTKLKPRRLSLKQRTHLLKLRLVLVKRNFCTFSFYKPKVIFFHL